MHISSRKQKYLLVGHPDAWHDSWDGQFDPPQLWHYASLQRQSRDDPYRLLLHEMCWFPGARPKFRPLHKKVIKYFKDKTLICTFIHIMEIAYASRLK